MNPLALARAVVWNGDEQRPRTPLRLLVHALLLVAALVGLSVPLLVSLGPRGFAGLPPLSALAVNVLVLGVAVVVATLLAGRYLDRRPLADLGLGADGDWWRDLWAGLALGGLLQTGIFLTTLGAGWTRVERVGGPDLVAGLALGALLMAAVGFYEELWFRGYYLTNLAEGLRALPTVDARRATLWATALTSVGFGLLHGTNPGATAVSSTLVAVYGAYLALGYLLTGDLALPVGFHAAWNYVQGFVYGFPISGIEHGASLLTTETTGPEVLTGGRFGPEAGLVGLGWVVLSLPLVWWWVSRTRGEVALRAGIADPDLRHQDGGAGERTAPSAPDQASEGNGPYP